MSKCLIGLLVLLSSAALVIGGCSSDSEMSKQDAANFKGDPSKRPADFGQKLQALQSHNPSPKNLSDISTTAK